MGSDGLDGDLRISVRDIFDLGGCARDVLVSLSVEATVFVVDK